MLIDLITREEVPALKLAEAWAELVHATQQYGEGVPYSTHLRDVEHWLIEVGMDSEEDRIIARLHDSIEDIAKPLQEMARQFVQQRFSPHVYESVWALTGVGKNRKERNAHAYAKIALYPRAADYKVADRFSNLRNAVMNGLPIMDMYLREDRESFRERVVSLATNQELVSLYVELVEETRPVRAKLGMKI